MPPMRPPIFGPPRAGFMRGSAPQFNTRGFFGPPMPRGGGFPLGAARAPKQSGGFLASLFGRGGGSGLAQQGASTVAKAAGGGSTLSNFMNSTQKVLAAGERVVPMVRQVQQYGPLIKNLPSMWKIYRGLSSTTTEESVEHSAESSKIESSSHYETSSSFKSSKKTRDESSHMEVSTELPKSSSEKPRAHVKPSVPKLFI